MGSSGKWVVASDLPKRLIELREHLGDSPEVFAGRFGRGESQWYEWQAGRQLPRRGALERAAKLHEWPHSVFEEGGPKPKDAVNRSVNEKISGMASEGASGLRERVDGLLEEIGFDAATFPPEAVLHAASVWIAAVLPTGPDEERAQRWLREVFEAGKRAGGQATGQARGTG